MVKKIRKLFPCVVIMALLPALTSCWWSGRLYGDTTTYNGSKTLANTSYKNLKINGSSTLSRVHVSGSFNCQGSAELIATTIDGTTDVSGTLKTRDKSVLNGTVHAPSIRAEDTIFGDIFIRSDKNSTQRFINSSVKNLYIDGLGDKLVILTNTNVDSIIFENPKNGIVRLQGNSTIGTTNGTTEYTNNISTN